MHFCCNEDKIKKNVGEGLIIIYFSEGLYIVKTSRKVWNEWSKMKVSSLAKVYQWMVSEVLQYFIYFL